MTYCFYCFKNWIYCTSLTAILTLSLIADTTFIISFKVRYYVLSECVYTIIVSVYFYTCNLLFNSRLLGTAKTNNLRIPFLFSSEETYNLSLATDTNNCNVAWCAIFKNNNCYLRHSADRNSLMWNVPFNKKVYMN